MADSPLIFQGIRSYVQGPGVLGSIGTYLGRWGPDIRTCILIDRTLLSLLEPIRQSLAAAGVGSFVVEFDGDTRRQSVQSLARQVGEGTRPDVVLGVGGGKTIDTAKILASRLGSRCVICAASSATDAAPSHAAVLLDANGRIEAETLEKNPDLVIVDSRLIASAPVRLFTAGIGDAISKKYEMDTAVQLGERNAFGGRPVFFISGMADTLRHTLLQYGVEAKQSVEKGELTESVERVITACVLLSTLVWENGGLAGAHSIANVLTDQGFAARNLHGELVAFGLLVLLALQGLHEERRKLDKFYRQIGLPRRIGDLGVAPEDREAVGKICRGVHERYKKHRLPYSVESIYGAIQILQSGEK